jgi:HEPN domain-containing protein
MDTSHNEYFQSILSNYKSAEDNFILYNDIITKIQNIHSALLTKNTFNFCDYSLNLDLLFFNKQIIDVEQENFIKYKKNCLRKFYQDLFLLLKQLIKSLYEMEQTESELEKDYIKKKIKDIQPSTNLEKDIDQDMIQVCVNTIKEYFESYKLLIDNFNTFIETNCLNKKGFDIKNVIVNLNIQYRKFMVQYEGLSSLFLEILQSHLIISNKLQSKIDFSIKLINDILSE